MKPARLACVIGLHAALALSGSAAEPASATTDPRLAEGRRITVQAFNTLSGQLMAAMARGGPTNAIDFCSTRALSLTEGVGQTNRVSLHRVSHAPRNPANRASEAELALIRRFQEQLKPGAVAAAPPAPPAPVLVTNTTGEVTFYAPIVLSNPLCLQCHGDPARDIAPATREAIAARYPADKATGFRLGDVRGLWRIGFGTGR